MLKKSFCLFLCLGVIILTSGCGKQKTAKYDINAPINIETSQTIASNSKLELLWDKTNFCVMLRDIDNNKLWSTIPYEYIQAQGTNNAVNSTLNITVMNSTSMKWDTVRGYTEACENGRISSEKIKEGIRVTYYFDNYKISIPVEYTLRSDSMQVVIKTNNISEGGEYRLAAISLNPYLTSAPNDDSSYLFIPAGSGALMYTDERVEKTRTYSGTVYGDDASRITPEITNDSQKVSLPVFGSVQSNNNALLGVIENGAESAILEAESGNKRTGWSTVYPTLYVRGYDAYPTNLHSWGYKDLKYLSDDISGVDIKVGYYPLNGNDANYNGMANCYRKYLLNNSLLSDSNCSKSIYSVSILGGLLKKVSTFGIPREKTEVLTSFNQAKTIVSDLIGNSGKVPSVQLVGYGNNGTDVGKIAGGFGFISAFGNKNERNSLEDYCKKEGIDLFTDFDLIRFSETGGGFSYLKDSAKSATLHIAESYYINNPLRDYDTDHSFRFLNRSLISKAVEKLIKTADKNNISGLSLSTLGSISYSDFSDKKYYTKGNTEKDVTNYLSILRNSNHKIAVSDANAYAATIADTVYEVPLTNGGYDSFDEWIPFYQMVFSGLKPMYSEYINISEESTSKILRAVASGTGLGFALSYNYDTDISINSTFSSYGILYKNNSKYITDTLKKYCNYLEKVCDSQLVQYEILDDGISISHFSNGVTIYVNHSDKTVKSPIGEMTALSVEISDN